MGTLVHPTGALVFCRLWKTWFWQLRRSVEDAEDLVFEDDMLELLLGCLWYISGVGGVSLVYHPHWGESLPPPITAFMAGSETLCGCTGTTPVSFRDMLGTVSYTHLTLPTKA